MLQSARRLIRISKMLAVLLVLAVMTLVGTAYAAAASPFEAAVADGNSWVKAASKQPGDYVEYLMTYRNTGSKTVRLAWVTAHPPVNTSTDESSIRLFNPAHPSGTAKFAITSDGTGVKLGSLKPGDVARLQYGLTLPSASKLACGDNTLSNTMVVTIPDTHEQFSAVAKVKVHRTCQAPKPVYTCDSFNPSTGSSGYVAVSDFRYTAAHGAVYQGATINWGDGDHAPLQKDLTLESHIYGQNGVYHVTANLYFTVPGKSGRQIVSCGKSLIIDSAQPIAPVVTTGAAQQPPQAPSAPASTDTTDATGAADTTSASDTADTTDTTDTSATASDYSPSVMDAADNENADTSTTDGGDTSSLPNTGAGDVVAWFGIAALLGVGAYQLWLRRPIRG